MEMAENRCSRGESVTVCRYAEATPLRMCRGVFYVKKYAIPSEKGYACEACGRTAMLPAGGIEKLNRELKQPRERILRKRGTG